MGASLYAVDAVMLQESAWCIYQQKRATISDSNGAGQPLARL